MWIRVGCSYSQVSRATDEELAWVRKYLSFEDTSQAGRRGKRIALYNEVTDRFPTGLLVLLQEAAKRQGYEIELVDQRVRPPIDPAADLSWLRDYQKGAVEAALAAGRGIIKLPTASGKGEIVVGLVRGAPCRWLFLVHNATLIGQTADRYKERTGVEPNVLVGLPVEAWRLVRGLNLSTFQTVTAALRDDKRHRAAQAMLDQAEGVQVDEAHTGAADTFFDVVQRCRRAYYKIGLSGTPLDRTDQKSVLVVAALGKKVYTVPAQELIDRGFLAAPKITMHPVTGLADSSRWTDAYQTLICKSEERNAAIVAAVRAAPKPCCVFVKDIQHGKDITETLMASDIPSELVFGEVPVPMRRAAIRRLERADIDAVVASVVFQEGVDIPSLASVVVASGGKSVIAALQRVGRGMRTDSGRKAEFEVHDILDRGDRRTAAHARARVRAYLREGYSVSIAEDGQLVPVVAKKRARP